MAIILTAGTDRTFNLEKGGVVQKCQRGAYEVVPLEGGESIEIIRLGDNVGSKLVGQIPLTEVNGGAYATFDALMTYLEPFFFRSVSGGGGGATSFVQLTDTPSNYTGQAGKSTVVNSSENGIEFVEIANTPITTEYEILLNSKSTATTQNPSGLDSPLQIEFGPAFGVPNTDKVALDALGTITVRDAQQYRFLVETQSGRTGGTGTSLLVAYFTVNGNIIGESIQFEIPNGNISEYRQIEIQTDLQAGDEVKFFIVRDPSGNDSGGLRVENITATGIPDSVTAAINVSELVSTGNSIGVPSPDLNAIHVNLADEIAPITPKANPIDTDVLIIEDSEDGNNKKSLRLANLPKGGASFLSSFPSASITGGTGSANTVYAIRFLCPADITVTEMGYFVTSIGNDNVIFGIYDGNKNLLDSTAWTSTNGYTVGQFVFEPLLSPITLQGGQDYWLAVKGNLGSINFGTQGIFTSSSIAISQFFGGTTLPATLTGGATSIGTYITIKE